MNTAAFCKGICPFRRSISATSFRNSMAEGMSPPTLPWRVITVICMRPHLTGIDPETGEIGLLFHPRRDVWTIHFALREAMMVG